LRQARAGRLFAPDGVSGMDAEKVATAVQRCIADATVSAQPFRSVNEFLASLKRQGWDEADRLAVQTQVLAALKQRRPSQPAGG
jgi:hypothetical protein